MIFISYRRTDCGGEARRLRDSLVSRFGKDHVFIDVDSIRPGRQFPEALTAALHRCDVLLALIGPTWSTERLNDRGDVVRHELETALRRKIVVIPVLVRAAEMPAPARLPGALRSITERQALRLSEDRWRSGVRALVAELDRMGAEKAAGTEAGSIERDRLRLAERRIDAQHEYNLATLRSRRQAVDGVFGTTRRELAASDKRAKDRQRALDADRRKLAAADPAHETSLLAAYVSDTASLAGQVTAQGSELSRRFDDMLNGAGALAMAPQPLPDLPSVPGRPPRQARRKPKDT